MTVRLRSGLLCAAQSTASKNALKGWNLKGRTMKTPSPKLALTAFVSAVGIAAMLTGPAFAQHRELSHHHRVARSPDPPLYNYAPGTATQLNSDTPYYGNAPYDQRDDW